jgi:hypothetical protein
MHADCRLVPRAKLTDHQSSSRGNADKVREGTSAESPPRPRPQMGAPFGNQPVNPWCGKAPICMVLWVDQSKHSERSLCPPYMTHSRFVPRQASQGRTRNSTSGPQQATSPPGLTCDSDVVIKPWVDVCTITELVSMRLMPSRPMCGVAPHDVSRQSHSIGFPSLIC